VERSLGLADGNPIRLGNERCHRVLDAVLLDQVKKIRCQILVDDLRDVMRVLIECLAKHAQCQVTSLIYGVLRKRSLQRLQEEPEIRTHVQTELLTLPRRGTLRTRQARPANRAGAHPSRFKKAVITVKMR
jgi:hypothetical protein